MRGGVEVVSGVRSAEVGALRSSSSGAAGSSSLQITEEKEGIDGRKLD